ncbi:MAG TPA: tetratricopeptide repeat protein [Opitutus sp.]|nr:tetratricopeptide repeat protein [Opitutus sp.]
MEEFPERAPWQSELDAIVGARHGGQSAHVLDLLKQLDARYPNVAEINHQLAWTCDILGRPAEAVTFYEKAVALGLPDNELAGALLGLGNVLRLVGEIERSAEVLRTAKLQFPENPEFDAFLTLTFHEQGRHAEALRLALDLLCERSEDPGIAAYQRALRYHAARLH